MRTAAAVLAALVCGCIYKGAKVTEGTDLCVGMSIPSTENTVQIDVINYLSGFRLGLAENSSLSLKYTTVETNSYFGCVFTRSCKTIDAKVQPCETAKAEER